MTVEGPIKDEEIGFFENDVVKLERIVEIYQNKETSERHSERDNFGGGENIEIVYHYNRVWSSSRIDSKEFFQLDQKHTNNSVEEIFHSRLMYNEKAKLGVFKLSDDNLQQLPRAQRASLQFFDVQQINQQLQQKAIDMQLKIETKQDCIYFISNGSK